MTAVSIASAATLQRVPDWPSRLLALVADARHRPFAWGSHDCVSWAATAVAAVTGTDLLADLRGAWSSERQACRLLRRQGGLHAATCARLGPPLSCVQLAQRGDVVLISTHGRAGLTVCLGSHVAGPGALQLELLPLFGIRPDAPYRPVTAWGIAHHA